MEGSIMMSVYCIMLLFVMGQRRFYLDLFSALWKPTLSDGTASAG
jgi:hypothetical protein